jgi:hypothetical protein
MAGQNAIKAGGAFVTLFTDNSPMVRGLKAARKEFDDWAAGMARAGAGLTAIGGAGLAGGMAAVKQFADAGSVLDDMSQRTGASIEALSRLGFAAQMGGSSLEAVEGGSKKLQKALGEAIGGNKEAAASFARLGLSVSAVAAMPLDQQMATIGEAITNIEDPVQRANAAMDIFGKSGTDLIPMFNGLSDAVARADQLGLTWTGEDAAQAAALGDRLDELTDVAIRTVEVIGGALAPAVMAMSEPLLEAAVATKEFIAENPGLVEGAAAAAAAIGGVGVVLVTAAAGITAVSMSFGVLAGVLSSPIVVAPALVGLGYLVTTQTDVGIKSVKALRDTFPGLSGAVDDAASSVGESFGMIAADVIDASGQAVGAWQGIVAAVSAGDLELAGEIAMTGLEAVWLASTASIRDGWDTTTAAVLSTWTDISAGMQSVGEDLTAWFSTMWLDIKGFAFDAFDAINSKWDSTSGSIAEVMIDVFAPFLSASSTPEQMKATLREDAERRQKTRDDSINKRGRDLAKEKIEIEENRQTGNKTIKAQRIKDQAEITSQRDDAINANSEKAKAAKTRLAELNVKAKAAADAKEKDKPKPKPKKTETATAAEGKVSGGEKPELQVSGLAASLTRGGVSSPDEQKVQAIEKTTAAVLDQKMAYDLLASAAKSAAEVAAKAAKDAGKTAAEQKKAADDAAAGITRDASVTDPKKVAGLVTSMPTEETKKGVTPEARPSAYDTKQRLADEANMQSVADVENPRDASSYDRDQRAADEARMSAVAASEAAGQTAEQQQQAGDNAATTYHGFSNPNARRREYESSLNPSLTTAPRLSLQIPDLSGVRLPDIASADRVSSAAPVEVRIDTAAQNALLGDIIAAVRSLESRVTNLGGLTA